MINKHHTLRLAMAAAALGCPPALLAQSSQPAPTSAYQDNRIDTLHYRTLADGLNFSGSLETYTPDGQTTSENGSRVSTTTRQHGAVGAGLTVGLFDELELIFAESYLLQNKSTTTNSKTRIATSSHNEGLSNPTVTLNYRYFGGVHGTRFASVYASIIPATGKAESGNNLSSDTRLGVGTHAYLVAGSAEFDVGADAYTYTTGKTTPSGDSRAITDDPYQVFDATASYRQHFLDSWYLQPALVLYLPYSRSVSNPNYAPPTRTRFSFPTRLTSSLAVGTMVRSDVVVDLSYSFASYTEDGTVTTKSTNAYSYAITQGVVTLAGNWAMR